MNIREEKEINVGGKTYRIAALDALYALKISMKWKQEIGNFDLTAEEMQDLILRSIKLPVGVATPDWFNKEFTRKVHLIRDLVDQILIFNFVSEDELGKEEGEAATEDK